MTDRKFFLDDDLGGCITVSCNRETHRLDRVLDAYHEALELAHGAGDDRALRHSLLKLHDHKGELSVWWADEDSLHRLRHYVDQAWYANTEFFLLHYISGHEEPTVVTEDRT